VFTVLFVLQRLALGFITNVEKNTHVDRVNDAWKKCRLLLFVISVLTECTEETIVLEIRCPVLSPRATSIFFAFFSITPIPKRDNPGYTAGTRSEGFLPYALAVDLSGSPQTHR
jgi:hypothetical protein